MIKVMDTIRSPENEIHYTTTNPDHRIRNRLVYLRKKNPRKRKVSNARRNA